MCQKITNTLTTSKDDLLYLKLEMKNGLIKKIYIPALILLLTCLGCSSDDGIAPSTACYYNSNAEIFIHNGIEREYMLYVPDSYDGSVEVPLMMVFHGFGGSASEFMMDADLRSLAERDSFLLVYPQGSCIEGYSHWNTCPTGGDNKSTAEDFDFVEALINRIDSEFNLNRERIYAAGYSNGGMMSYGLAHYKSDLIAAIGSVSGAMLDCYGSTNHPMPVVLLHGTQDDDLPYDGNTELASVQSTLDYWINFNNTSTSPSVTTDNSGPLSVQHSVYSGGDNGVSVEHYRYQGGEHVWFDATYQGRNASELVWNFVSRYDINGLR